MISDSRKEMPEKHQQVPERFWFFVLGAFRFAGHPVLGALRLGGGGQGEEAGDRGCKQDGMCFHIQE